MFLVLAALAESPTISIEDGRLVLPSPVTFTGATATLDPSSTSTLQSIADFMAAKSYITLLRVEGHVPDGQALSEQRALAAAHWLVAHGVDCKRLIPVGFGGTKPIADDSTPEGKAANTRLEWAPAMLRGLAIGGMPTDGGGVVAGDPCKP